MLHKVLGTRLNFSTTFHPQTGGQSERTIQILEGMLWMCVMDFDGQWDTHLPLIKNFITVNMQVLKWLHTKLYIEENANHLCVGKLARDI